jgi:Leucine-rich repeat (LRR) protein
MKKVIISSLILVTLVFGVNAQNVNIPDANFKAYLVGNASINTNGDTEIQVSEASAFTGAINCFNLGISDLTGIETFTAIIELICTSNNLSSLDVSNNTSLIYLYCEQNLLTSLDVSANTDLLDLECSNNNLSSLDVSANTNLEIFYCSNNNLSSIDLQANTALLELECLNNNLISVDVSTHINLQYLRCDGNNLSSLNVANGNNGTSGLNYINATNNPNLTCIQHDTGFNPTANSSWTKDATASWSDNCNFPCTINIPDANFKAALVGNASINTNGDTEIQCAEASAFNGFMNIENLNISDLTGIETFINMNNFRCNNNNLTSMDLSANTALTYLKCNSNNLTSINLSGLTDLVNLDCYNNSLTNIDVSGLASLLYLKCYNNDLTSLITSGASVLESINCSNNNLTNLDVSNNTALTSLSSAYNPLTNLDVSNNVNLLDLYCEQNLLTSLDVSNNTSLEYLDCTSNSLTSLDLSSNSALTELYCSNNNLNSLNIQNGANAAINTGSLYAQNNPNLTCIQVDDVAYSTTNWANIDPTASFSLNCVGAILVSSISVQGQGGVSTITTSAGTLQMEATVLPANANDATYTWSVTNGTGSASINAGGILTALTNGTVDVIATANDGSGITGTATITISNQSVGINELDSKDILIYPNPASNELFIDVVKGQINQIQIIDYTGRVAKSMPGKQVKIINVSNLTHGIYILKISTENGISTKQFVKN